MDFQCCCSKKKKKPYNTDDIAIWVMSRITCINFNPNRIIRPKSPQNQLCHEKFPWNLCIKEATFSKRERLNEEGKMQRKKYQESRVHLSQTHMLARVVSRIETIMRWKGIFYSQQN